MQKIVQYLRKLLHPSVFVVIVIAMIGVVIWLFGERFGYGGVRPLQDQEIREFVAIGFWIAAALWAAFLLLRWTWRKIAARRKGYSKEPTLAEREASTLDKVFAAAIHTIRDRWSGTGRSIYGLPWFLLSARVAPARPA